tara:strand:- start:429 stop:716 length:288 start_codon:yes stop_codon:yes gene_type:complete
MVNVFGRNASRLSTVLLGIVLGTAYYYNMSLSIPKESNCSFSANIWTDVWAFVFGAILVAIGFRSKITTLEKHMILFCGTAIIVEHVWQLVHNKI